MNFEGMSPQQAAETIVYTYGGDWPEQQHRCIEEVLAAIQHFSNRNLIAARRWEYLKDKTDWYGIEFPIEEAEKEFPDA